MSSLHCLLPPIMWQEVGHTTYFTNQYCYRHLNILYEVVCPELQKNYLPSTVNELLGRHSVFIETTFSRVFGKCWRLNVPQIALQPPEPTLEVEQHHPGKMHPDIAAPRVALGTSPALTSQPGHCLCSRPRGVHFTLAALQRRSWLSRFIRSCLGQ